MSSTNTTTDHYDFIIVGAGSAGAVMAERLSASGQYQVLLLEEGPNDNTLSRMPRGFGKLLTDPKHAFFFPTTRQYHNKDKQEIWARGKMLGGSSAINGMVWTRGIAKDYDRLEALGNEGWGWTTMLPYFRKLEDHQLGPSEYRGTGGPIEINTNPRKTPLADAFIKAGQQTGLPLKDDQNGPKLEGVGYAQWNIDRNGRRVSSYRAFLEKAQNRPNLFIRTDTKVRKVIVEDKRATGIEAISDNQPVTFKASKDIILCAGGIVSPHLLQLSGIGDSSVLAQAGISVVHHSPNVGRRMREHLTMPLNFRLKHWRDSDNRAFGGFNLIKNVLRFFATGKGVMSMGAAEAVAFVRCLPSSIYADAQLMFNSFSLDSKAEVMAFENEPGMQVYSYILRPESEGSVIVTSPDPNVLPAITPNYLATEKDQATAIAATRAIRHIMSQQAMKEFVISETEDTIHAQSDEEIVALHHRSGQSGYHAVGTAAMGPNEDDVLDCRLKVRGVQGLRVMDCSVFPEIPSGNTNAPTMAAAWRASDLILEDYGS